jgi:hypothetical protein
MTKEIFMATEPDISTDRSEMRKRSSLLRQSFRFLVLNIKIIRLTRHH